MAEVIVVASASAHAASALARRRAARHARIAMVGPDTRRKADLAGDLVARGATAVLAIPCDVTDLDEVRAVAARIEAELGAIDTWINTAMSDAGYVCGTRAALASMQARDRGTIVQVAAPRSVRMFADGLRAELRLAGSHVVLESVRTQPLRRLGALAMTGAAIVGAALLRRAAR